MSRLEVAISLPGLADFSGLYEREIVKGGVFVETPGRSPDVKDPITVVFRVDGVPGTLRLHGEVVRVMDGAAGDSAKAGVGVQLYALDAMARGAIEAVLGGDSQDWPEVVDPEVSRLVRHLQGRIERAAGREILKDLGLPDDPTVAQVDDAFSSFTREYHPDRFASLSCETIKELSTRLFALTKKRLDRVRSEAERAEKHREAVKAKVAERAAVDPTKGGTTNPLQQPRVATEAARPTTGTGPQAQPGSRPRTLPVPGPGTRPVPRPGTGPAARPGTQPVPRPGTGPIARPGTQPVPRPGTGPIARPGTQPVPRPGTRPAPRPDGTKTRAGMSSRGRVDPIKEAARGRMALRRKAYKEAANHFARAVLADPDSAEYLALLGRAKFLSDRDSHDEAQKLLEKAAKNDPHYEWTWVYMGQMAKLLGHDRRAMEHFRRALQINPNNSDAKLEVRVFERRAKAKSAAAAGPTTAKKDKSLLGGLFGRGKKK